MRDYPFLPRGALIFALAASVTLLDLTRPQPEVPWIGLAMVGLAISVGTIRPDENRVMRPRGWQTALMLISTIVMCVVMIGRVLERWG
jgi:hypothetical protein